MNLNEWTQTAAAVANARVLMEGQTFKEMMEVMRDEMPLVRVPLAFGASATDFAYAHGMQKGYEFALKVLKAMGESAPELTKEPVATFSSYNNE